MPHGFTLALKTATVVVVAGILAVAVAIAQKSAVKYLWNKQIFEQRMQWKTYKKQGLADGEVAAGGGVDDAGGLAAVEVGGGELFSLG